MDKKEYIEYVEARSKKSPIIQNLIRAFLIGGAICSLGQALLELYRLFIVELKDAQALVSITLIAIAILLTGIGIFDNIARVAGAGTLVPITGFANAIASCAIDTKSEGYVMGVGAKIFSISGPVILFGTFSGVIYGIFYYFITMFWG
ncbi:MAG: SpoVA/SpoVAEb family sporulation membrane protein [Clostridia bacterium]|nr:SpoVA/SpoVAEb family sporulation membrane protein [Clostridia bacterium]